MNQSTRTKDKLIEQLEKDEPTYTFTEMVQLRKVAWERGYEQGYERGYQRYKDDELRKRCQSEG